MTDKYSRLSIYLNPDLIGKLRKSRCPSKTIRKALEEYFNKDNTNMQPLQQEVINNEDLINPKTESKDNKEIIWY